LEGGGVRQRRGRGEKGRGGEREGGCGGGRVGREGRMRGEGGEGYAEVIGKKEELG